MWMEFVPKEQATVLMCWQYMVGFQEPVAQSLKVAVGSTRLYVDDNSGLPKTYEAIGMI
jgi:hypothetical protein